MSEGKFCVYSHSADGQNAHARIVHCLQQFASSKTVRTNAEYEAYLILCKKIGLNDAFAVLLHDLDVAIGIANQLPVNVNSKFTLRQLQHMRETLIIMSSDE